MNGRVLVSGVLTLGLAAAAFVSPIGWPAVSGVLEQQKLNETRMATSERNLQVASDSLLSAVNEFNNARTFDVYYGDVPKLSEVFSGIAGIEVKDIYKCDPSNGFIDSGYLVEGDSPAAVRFSLVTDDPSSALSVILKMELPVYSISWESPNSLSVIVLTGGEV